MGIRDKAKKKAEKDMNRGGNNKLAVPEGTQFFAPKSKGPYKLDVLPYTVSVSHHPEVKKGEQWYQRTYFVHYGLGESGKQSAICPKTIGKPCPVCELYKELAGSEDEDDRESAKNIKPKERELYNVIDLDNQDAGVQIFEYSWHLFGKALSEEINEGSEEEAGFAELEEGKTLVVSFRKKKLGQNPFFEVRKIDFEDREDYDEEILEDVHDLDALLTILTYSELAAMLHGTGEDENENNKDEDEDENEDNDNDEDEDEDEKKSKKKDKDKKGKSKDKGKSSSKKGKSNSSSKKKKDEDEDEDEDNDDDDDDENSGRKSSSKRPGKVDKNKNKKSKEKCPGAKKEGGRFGVDVDQLKACKNCEIWTDCQEAYEESEGEDDDE